VPCHEALTGSDSIGAPAWCVVLSNYYVCPSWCPYALHDPLGETRMGKRQTNAYRLRLY